MLSVLFLKNNHTLLSIILFVLIFTSLYYLKPKWLFNEDGSIREFGIGYQRKTILPLWLVSIILGIFCYLFTLFFIKYKYYIHYY